MHIARMPHHNDRFSRKALTFRSARSGFKAFLQAANMQQGEQILLPAYVGWSSREGSGVLDPIEELGLAYSFYRVDASLHIDLEHLRGCFQRRTVRILVLIHFFGHVDPNYAAAVAIARARGSLVVEDEAHAMLTDLVGGISGQLGDVSILSLHKILPIDEGGMLLLNPQSSVACTDIECPVVDVPDPWDFDLHAISRKRRSNAALLALLLEPLRGQVDSLWGTLPEGVIPQTYPVLIRSISRDEVYFRMKERGFGVVSLYHTLTKQIGPSEFPVSHQLSNRICNLPVHQDVTSDVLDALVEQLTVCVRSSGADESLN